LFVCVHLFFRFFFSGYSYLTIVEVKEEWL